MRCSKENSNAEKAIWNFNPEIWKFNQLNSILRVLSASLSSTFKEMHTSQDKYVLEKNWDKAFYFVMFS